MLSIRQFAIRFTALFRRTRLEQDMNEEVRAHLEMMIEENVRRGMSRGEARFAALREFGGIDQMKEVYREQRGLLMFGTLIQDLRYGLRILGKSPAFTSVVVLSLALGIGANTAIFSLIDAVMLKMVPVSHPEELLQLHWSSKVWPDAVLDDLEGSTFQDESGSHVTSGSFSYAAYRAIRDGNHVFSDTFAVAANDIELNVGIGGRAESANGRAVSGNYFTALGVTAALGRTLIPSDDSESSPPAAVLSYDFWNKRFGHDPSVLGQTVILDGMSFTIVGVTPPEFFGLEPGASPDISVPLSLYWKLYRIPELANDSRVWWMLVDGRLKPGVTSEQARAELSLLFHQNVSAAGASKPKAEIPFLSIDSASQGLDTLRRKFSKPLWVLTGLVGLVLLIACANVASLLLARATARQKEIAVRLSLGSGRARLIRQLLTESIMLSLCGGALGVLFAVWGDSLLLNLMSSGRDAISLNVHLNFRILAFTATLSILTGIVFGLVPAFRATRVDLTPALKDNGTTLNAERHGLRPGKALVVAQIAISLLLLVGAGLFVRTLGKLEAANIGFNREHLLLFSIQPGLNGYEGARLGSLYKELQRRIGAVPGVKSASLSQHTLIGAGSSSSNIWIPGYAAPGTRLDVRRNLVGPHFFETLGIPLLLGRAIEERDDETSPKIAVINQKAVRDFFHGDNPVGKQIDLGSMKQPRRMEVVGVVGDAKDNELRNDPPPTVFLPYLQNLRSSTFMSFEVRTSGDPKSIVAAIRNEVHATDKDLPMLKVVTETEQIEKTVFLERLFARLTSLFGLLGLSLACVGLYGIMAYAVARRTKEIGIRLALGAQRNSILAMVMRETALLIFLGVAIGIAGALATTRMISSFLFGLEPTDPLTILAATFLMSVVVALAGYLPARRATKVDPMVALRYE
ncbi:MAG TPA: ABC transporter permease [Terriglobia bacterium]|nr:ABC transporter permease [Terriglobia bacterium]